MAKSPGCAAKSGTAQAWVMTRSSSVVRPLQEGAAVQPQRLDDAPLGLLDQAVHLVGRHVDEAGREVGEERLEPQPLLQFRPQGVFRAGHRATPCGT